MRQRLHLIILLFIALSTAAMADDTAKFRQFMASQGLSDNSVLCFVRDKYGFAWFGTANGLNCFDGTTNSVYRNIAVTGKGNYGSDVVSAIAEYGDDMLVGGINGLSVYRRATNTFERFTVATKYGVTISSIVQTMFTARNGMVLIGTYGQGVFIYQPASGRLVQNSRHGGFVSSICQTADGTLCLAMLNGDINMFSASGRFIASCSIPGYRNDKNPICMKAHGNVVWIGTDEGLYRMDKKARTVIKCEAPSRLGVVNAIAVTGRSTLCLGTRRGLYGYDTGTQRLWRIDGPDGVDGLTDTYINGVSMDADGTLWVLTNMGGVCYLPKHETHFRFNRIGGASGGTHTIVNTFVPAGNGNMWVGTTGGLYFYDHATGHTTPYRGGLITDAVRALMLDGSKLWVGTVSDGIMVVDLASGKTRAFVYSENEPYTVISNEITCIYRTRQGNILVATKWGMCWFDRRTERFMTYSQLSSMTSFEDICEDRDGNVWAATTSDGMYRYVPQAKQWWHYAYNSRQADGLTSNALTAITCDRNGKVWVATKGGGVCVYDKASDTFRPVSGIMGNVNFIVPDRQGGMWAATEKELVSIPRGDIGSVVHVDSPDELWRGRIMKRAAVCSADGMMYVGSFDGFYTFRPSLIKDSRPSHVYVTSLSLPYLSDSKVELEKLGLNRPLYINNNVRLPYRDNSFTIHFASPQFSSAQNPRYEYMLRGVDKQWMQCTGNADATYSNVAPGTYEFLLRMPDGNGSMARLTVTVLPPWYRTLAAYMVYLLVIAIVAYLVWRRAQRVIRRRYNRQLEKFRVEQEKKVFESKITFFVNLVHEIRTPLSLITLPLERIRQRQHDHDESRYLSVISKNVGYLLSITNQLLDFQKVENGKFEIHRANSSMSAIMRNTYGQFSALCDAEGRKLEMQLPDDDITIAVDEAAVGKILMNLMGNAVKYTRTRITMRLLRGADGMVEIQVEDDGPGIPDADKKRIFDTFYQVSNDNVAKMMGTGLGLTFSKTIAVAHGGDLCVADAPGGGSCFRLLLPDTQVDAADEHSETVPHAIVDVPPKVEANPDTRSFVVLLVEDNAQLLEMTGEVLSDWYKVIRARNGSEAIDILDRNDVDVVVSDVMMPVMDGLELCTRVKSNVETSHIPVILLTAKTNVEAKVEGLRCGADVYLEKPFAIEQLHMQIENLFRLRQKFHKRMGAAEGALDATSASDFGINQQNMAFLEKVQEILDANISDENFSIDTLAEQMFMSRSSFYRKLKSLVGMTPVEFLKAKRMKRASQLLIEGGVISDVAVKVGFSSPSYFTKCFKQAFGVLPKDFVAQKLKELENDGQA